MRLLLLHHEESDTLRIRHVADSHGARNLATLAVEARGRRLTLFSVANPRLESLIQMLEIQKIDGLGIEMLPHEVMSVPPGTEPDEEVARAGARSPVEIYLDSLSSIGGWGSYLSYAAIAGLLAWSGLYTQTMYLLVAAMLVAPYPNPVLNTAIATARGHSPLLVRSVGRYFLALAIGVAAAFGLSAAFGVDRASGMAHAIASLSTAAFLLPLAAGIIGAIYLSESEKSSLVSAAAAGILVTAALSPPVAIVGTSLWTGETPLALRALFLLLLQIVGINLTAAATFWIRGLKTSGPWYHRGRRGVAVAGGIATVVALAALLGWQLSSPDMQRGSVAREAVSVARQQVDDTPSTRWVTGSAAIHGEGADAVLLATLRARWTGPPETRGATRRQLAQEIRSALEDRGYPEPLIDLTLLD